MKQIHPWLRYVFSIGSFLGLLAGIELFFLSSQTDLYFAWTIQSTLTAATFGAFYFGAMIFGLLALREKVWAHVRGPAFGLLIFIILTLIATLLHFDRFHFGSGVILARASAWLWMSVYVLLPVAMLVALNRQARLLAADPKRTSRLSGLMRVLLTVHATLSVNAAALLFLAPQAMIPIWPWTLTPLTARALAAWLASFGVVSLQSLIENDWGRLRIMAFGYIGSSLLAMIAAARFADQMNWQSVNGVSYLVYLLVMAVIGISVLLNSRRG
ncbi:MAG TPA: hypothetical protein VK897_04815 [Anaerolineales bacterium]|nr:hypothetical protein [Anaerolineales bacterium]